MDKAPIRTVQTLFCPALLCYGSTSLYYFHIFPIIDKIYALFHYLINTLSGLPSLTKVKEKAQSQPNNIKGSGKPQYVLRKQEKAVNIKWFHVKHCALHLHSPPRPRPALFARLQPTPCLYPPFRETVKKSARKCRKGSRKACTAKKKEEHGGRSKREGVELSAKTQ